MATGSVRAGRRTLTTVFAAATLTVGGVGVSLLGATPAATAAPGTTRDALVSSHLFVANNGANSVTEYAVGADGNVLPVATISGQDTELSGPYGVALDGAGDLFVANADDNTVSEYAAGASGDATPIAIITGSGGELRDPRSVTLDASGNLFVSSSRTQTVQEYPAGANGDDLPIAVFGVGVPWGVAVSAAGDLFVTNVISPYSVIEYAAGSIGQNPPSATISGSSTRLFNPVGVALDDAGNLFVTNNDTDAVTEYAEGASGNATPIAIISGSSTKLSNPVGVALDDAGDLFVTNASSDTVTE